MRLIDADAEIVKIEQEIQKIELQIKEWEDNREDRSGYHDVDSKIRQFKSNISQARIEIEYLRRYSTAYDEDKVVDQVMKDCFSMGFDESQVEIIVDDIKTGGVHADHGIWKDQFMKRLSSVI